MEFLLVYIREAHASDAWQISSNERDGVVHKSPANEQERCSLAQTCTASLEVKFPALADGFDNATDEAYTAWPERLYLVGADGRIAYMSLPGPFGFEPADLRATLEAMFEPEAPR